MDDSIDFAALWQSYKEQDINGRSDSAVDLAFWAAHASDYDASHGQSPQLLSLLQELVRPDDTILDVGAGTGRFALPLAQKVKQITALDHSPDMLSILRQKINQYQVSNIRIIEASWEVAEVEPHDVVLAAWSLYRQSDLLAAMRKLVASTQRVFIIVESDDDAPQYPHHPLVTEIWGEKSERNLSKYLGFLGALWQIGIRAEVRIVYETGYLHGLIPKAIAGQLAPAEASLAQLNDLTNRLQPLLRCEADGWSYTFTYPVELLIWHTERNTNL